MSLIRTFERATSCRKTQEIASQSLFAFLCPALYDQVPGRRQRRRERREESTAAVQSPSAQEMENCFISALARAGSCHVQWRPTIPSLLSDAKSRARPEAWKEQRRGIHTKPTRPAQEQATAQAISKEDLHSLVDIYDTRAGQEDLWPSDDQGDHVGIGPEVLDKPWDEAYFTQNQYMVFSAPCSDTSQILHTMDTLLDNPNTPHEHLYALYKQLPGDRANYIPSTTLRTLMTHLSHVPTSRFQKEYASNFLSLLYDLRAVNLPVTLPLWTTAIRFIGLSDGARQAVRLWREMEQHYTLKANNYTFSVLFDLAVKSGNFALAEMLEKEARERRVRLDRISRMSRIFYYGLLGDGAGIRNAYAGLVEAGEIVDTAVLTNVISALIDAGEVPAAEETFARMKTLHEEKQGATAPPHDWRSRRELRGLLTDAAHTYRDRHEDRQRFQDAAPVGPDWRTYRAFISYHVRSTGDWPAIERLLTEMRSSRIPLTREIFRTLFAGFAKHGGIQVVAWNSRNLEHVWKEFEKCVRRRPGEFAYDPRLVLGVVRAFVFCANKTRAKEVWESMLERWAVDGEVEKSVERLLQRRRRWDGG